MIRDPSLPFPLLLPLSRSTSHPTLLLYVCGGWVWALCVVVFVCVCVVCVVCVLCVCMFVCVVCCVCGVFVCGGVRVCVLRRYVYI
jgi:hypothetical protein